MILYIAICFLISFSYFSFGQQKILRAYLDEKQYCAPQTGNYVEIQLQYVGHTIYYKPTPNGLQGEVAVLLNFFKNDSLVVSDGFRLQSP